MLKPDFKKSNGLIPVIIQDHKTYKVLMLGYMNEDALKKSTEEKRVTFFSRSKNRLWTKGEESGNYLSIKDIKMDCDNDTLLIAVLPAGPVCHTGADTCFNENNEDPDFLIQLEKTILNRMNHPDNGSYTSSLFAAGINKIAQKVGEEAIELVIEAKDNDPQLFKAEAADLLFHYLVLLQAKGCTLSDVIEVLKSRNSK